MSVQLTILISIFSLLIAAISFIVTFLRNNKKDTTEEVEERATMTARVLTKLDTIADDLRDIKKDNQDMRKEIQLLNNRVLILEERVQIKKVEFASGYGERVEK